MWISIPVYHTRCSSSQAGYGDRRGHGLLVGYMHRRSKSCIIITLRDQEHLCNICNVNSNSWGATMKSIELGRVLRFRSLCTHLESNQVNYSVYVYLDHLHIRIRTSCMVLGWNVDLEAPPHISELNSAIASLTLQNAIALFSSEMCGGASKSTSHPQTMMWGWGRISVRHPVNCTSTYKHMH